jgi:ubiquinone/menaquinone biosynthesis C-methylase UbiE
MNNNIQPSLKLFKVFADETRLKLLMILQQAEFTVGELVKILDIHQSNTSRHLSQLRDVNLVEDRREGALVYYRWSEILRNSQSLQAMLKSAWEDLPEYSRIEGTIKHALEERKKRTQSFFDTVAGKYSSLAQPGGGKDALLQAYSHLLKINCCADIGAGEGDLSLLFARSCQQVYAIDLNEKMLQIINKRAQQAGITNIITKQGDLEAIPLPDNSMDLVIMSHVLHHLPNPESAFPEISRILHTDGKFLLLDLVAHDQEWMREKLGDLWLGFSLERVKNWLKKHNLNIIATETVAIDEGMPVMVIIGQPM